MTLAQRIHISESCYKELSAYGGFLMLPRKEKHSMFDTVSSKSSKLGVENRPLEHMHSTYWLIGRTVASEQVALYSGRDFTKTAMNLLN